MASNWTTGSSGGLLIEITTFPGHHRVLADDGLLEGRAEEDCLLSVGQQVLFQGANAVFLASFLSPNGKYGTLFMHSFLVLGFLLLSVFAWNLTCSPGVFGWNFTFILINLGQATYMLYSMREVQFPSKELEDIYETLFEPMKVSRALFKRMVSSEYCQTMSLHSGEAYAMQGLTKTDRLGLLLSGRVSVISGNHLLHAIEPRQFLDSPEFESHRLGTEDKFKVSIIATGPCRYLCWQRLSFEYLLLKETFLAHVLSLLLAKDIAHKLYAMNDKIVTEKGTHLDIRLPSITSSLCNSSTSLASGDGSSRQGSPARTGQLGIRVKDRVISPKLLTPKSLRSKSLQTNSLGSAVALGLLPVVRGPENNGISPGHRRRSRESRSSLLSNQLNVNGLHH